MKNASLCERLALDKKNAAQASAVLKGALQAGLIKAAEADNVRTGYLPSWA